MINLAKKRSAPEEEGGSWMDTYGDMITLVLTFFILLYSMSTMDSSKWQYIAQAFSRGNTTEDVDVRVVGEPNPENDPTAVYQNEVPEIDEDDSKIVDFEDFYLYLMQVVESNGISDSVSVEMSKTGVYMRFRDNVFFAGDSDVLLDEGKYILEIICDGIRQVNERINSIKVSGHTAGSATSSANEWNLSGGRANSVINFMISLDSCDDNKFSSAGYGKYRPIESNDTDEGRRQNRRVEIVFMRNDIDYSDPEVLKELIELEYGRGFITDSAIEGSSLLDNVPEIEDIPDTTETSTVYDPDRVYVSKEDAIADMKQTSEQNS